jgi:hypothetical protein
VAMSMPNCGAGAACTAMPKDSTETMAAALNNMLQVYDTSWVEKMLLLVELVCESVVRFEVPCWFSSRRFHGERLPVLYSWRSLQVRHFCFCTYVSRWKKPHISPVFFLHPKPHMRLREDHDKTEADRRLVSPSATTRADTPTTRCAHR